MARITNDDIFEAWMRTLDRACISRLGVSIHDLADEPFRAWFDDEMSVDDALDEILEAEGIDWS